MKQILENTKTGEVYLEEVPPPKPGSGGLLVRNIVSLISPGTEKLTIELGQKSLLGKARERPDLVKQVMNKVRQEGIFSTYQKVKSRLETPTPLGYSCAGEIYEVGDQISDFQVGDRVACSGVGYASHAEMIFVPKNLCIKLPESVNFEQASFTTLGAIALQGVRQAEPTLGEKIAVIGLGLLGQLTVQLLKASGCKVIAVDLDELKVHLARKLGADCVALREGNDVVAMANAFSQGYGVDAVIITAATSSNDPIQLAGEIARDRARIVVVGAVRLDVPRNLYYKKELDLRLSRSYGPGRYDSLYEEKGIDYPIGYVRWTEKRNMEEFIDLVAEGKIRLDELITHRFKLDEAEKAYKLISGNSQEKYLGILLQYQSNGLPEQKILIKDTLPEVQKEASVVLGVIGSGSFAKGILLPNLKKIPHINFKGVCTARGFNAKHVGQKFGFDYCTTDYNEILSDSQINALVIATRHDLHAKLVIEGLKSGKAIFVEKPLATTIEELRQINRIYIETDCRLMVGFNRRFSPHLQNVKKFFDQRKGPLQILYRINAGYISPKEWIQDPHLGGGRIVGEVCHFIDCLQFLVQSSPRSVFAQTTHSNNDNFIDNDNIFVTISFSDGSIGEIAYTALGDKRFPKEYLEVYGDGSVAVLSDFKVTKFYRNGKENRFKTTGQQKGHAQELKAWIESCQSNGSSPIPFNELVSTTMLTFKIQESIQMGKVILC